MKKEGSFAAAKRQDMDLEKTSGGPGRSPAKRRLQPRGRRPWPRPGRGLPPADAGPDLGAEQEPLPALARLC